MTDLSDFGAGIDRRHVSLMDLGRAVLAVGICDPGNADPIRSWRPFQEEIQDRVFTTTLYAVRRACPDAPPAPDPYPAETDYAHEIRQSQQESIGQVQVDADGGHDDVGLL